MSNNLNVYLLDPRLPAEVSSVAFAMCSRSPLRFTEILDKLNVDKSANFNETWVNQYGHSSVMEHAVLRYALENLSILATKVIEDNRLASFTEKSTRYQIFDRTKYLIPEAFLSKPKLLKIYTETSNLLFDTYTEFVEILKVFMRTKFPPAKNMTPEESSAYERMIKTKACDDARSLLTPATLTNMGMTINARNLRGYIIKCLNHPLEEMQRLGMVLKEIGDKELPTLLKRAEKNNYLIEMDKNLKTIASRYESKDSNTEEVQLLDYDPEAENKLIATLLFKRSQMSYSEILRIVTEQMDAQDKEEILNVTFKDLGEHNIPPRECESIYYTTQMLFNFGIFRDYQRMRMATQLFQKVSTQHGYEMPSSIYESGHSDKFQFCMKKAKETFNILVAENHPNEAQYIVPFGYRIQDLYVWNLREMHHLIPLRSKPTGHPAYRRITYKLYEEIRKVHPNLAKYIRIDPSAKELLKDVIIFS